MAKNKLVKKITIDKLAEIINDGFNGQTEYMDKRFNKIEQDLTTIKGQADIENLLAIPGKKH